MASSQARHILITGPPGVGKTTLVRKCCESIKNAGVSSKGFYTEEVRQRGQRTGFDVVTLDGRRGTLATLQDSEVTTGRQYIVGRYKVNLASFESISLTSLKLSKDNTPEVFVVDEIGKMELFSQSFIRMVKDVFNCSNSTVLATIPVPKGRPIAFVEEVRSRKDAIVFNVTKANRDNILDDIVKAVTDSVKINSSG